MKKQLVLGLLAVGFALTMNACNNDQSSVSPDDSATATGAARAATDSVGFHSKKKLTKIETSALPSAVSSYITTTYSGATVDYAAKDDDGNYFVGITQNGTRKALLFNADGTFNHELALKKGPGKGPGGKRDSLAQVAITSLPSAITSYISANYAGATVNMAVKDDNRGYLVMITVNDTRKTLLFNTDGTFNQELVKVLRGKVTEVAAADLPAAITSYITTNYAGSTIKRAGKLSDGQYIVSVKPASGNPVDLLFAADGTFKQVLKHR
nr:PepSY-like domain-containing protein [uncultured Arsenicibacter sp.]